MKDYDFMKKRILLIAVLVLVSLALVGCGEFPQNDWLQAPAWSRSQWVGNTLGSDDVPFVVDDATQNIYFFLSSPDEEIATSNVRAFDQEMNFLWETHLNHKNEYSNQMRIILQDDFLFMFWIDGYSLFQASMTTDGNVVMDARELSGDMNASRIDVIETDEGSILLWFSGNKSNPGIYQLTSEDDFTEIEQIYENGYQPFLRKDVDGNVHAVFLSYENGLTLPTIYYSSSVEEDIGSSLHEIKKIKISNTTVFYGPWIGIENDQAYIFWSEKITTGMTAGTKKTHYVTLDLNSQEMSKDFDVKMPYEYSLPYEYESSSELVTGARFDMAAPASIAGGYVTFDHMQTNTTPASELALIAEAKMKYKWRNESFQSAILYYDEGVPTSYQLLTFTSYDSRDVNILSDENGIMHASWTENNSENGTTVYYATTNPVTVAALANLNLDDYKTMAAEVVFEVLAGIAISPLVGAIYLIAPLLIVAITSFMRKLRNEKLNIVGTIVSLGVAILAYESIKMATLPGYETFIPFSPWIRDISYSMGLFLQKAVPVALFAFAAFVGWWFTYHRSAKNALNFIMLYVGTNVILSMMLYGLLLYYAV